MAKKERKWELNRKQYQQIRKMDHNQMEQYMASVYEQGVSAGRQQASGSLDVSVAIESNAFINKIKEAKPGRTRLGVHAGMSQRDRTVIKMEG